ncbi:autotransporter outer membrane beta-barrel domain-containing protein [Campylobacter mucosalis]|uniref:Putative autotransporter beta-domain protein n=1 Tax=Campylobacter mucosalis CCUG 21559 TaxID=1032067 RepID=A0A6G5QF74_9BACT|nr:autotransporter outer membrane beta-barrel domain-containing protein [Campylobacter mucosalis]QCD44330.1 putative autotransporter beta-domain protein [Campylobacter mucosalis CCUG 21559]
MKFSKIACVALLSASISTVALADNELKNLQDAKIDEATRTAAYKEIIEVVNSLKTIGYENLAKWNGAKAVNDGVDQLKEDVNGKIYDAFGKIEALKDKIAPKASNLEIKGSENSKLVIGNDKSIKITITDADNTAVQETSLTLSDFEVLNKDKIKEIFAENNRDVWQALIKDFTNKHNELKAKRDAKIQEESLKFAASDQSLVVTPNDKYSAYIESKNDVKNAINADIKSKQGAVVKAKEEVSKAIKATDAKKVTLLSTDNKRIMEQEQLLTKIGIDLGKAKEKPASQENNLEKATALKAAIDAGAKLKRKDAEETLLTKDDIDAILAGGAGKVKVVAGDFDNGGANNLTGDENIKKVLDALIGEVAQNGAAKATKAAQTEIEKIADKINDVSDKETELKGSNDLMAKFEDIVAKATSDESITATKSTELKLAIERKDADQIKTAQQELKNAANARATGVTKVANLEEKQGEVLGSFTDTVLANDTVKSIVTTYDAKELADTAKALNTSIEQSQRSQNKGTSTDIIMFNTGLATNTRLAKLSNPFNADLALAQAINELEGETFADAGDSLSSVIKEYTNRFNHDNNLWGNIFGGKGKIKDSANPSIWGVTLGYDKAFDNTIVGGFINYAKVQSKDSQVRSESDNYSFGVYSRSYFDQSEIDAKIGYGFGRNELSRHAMDSKIGTSTGKYDSKFFDVDVEYGYVFGLGNAMFIKPIAGLSYTHIKHDGFTEDGNVPAIFGNTTLKTLKAKLGSEFRVYTDNAGYFYITPGVERELSKSANDLSVKFVGSSKDVVFDADKKKNTYITLKTGAEFKITNNLSTNINFGAKAKAKEQYYNGTLGVSYKF